MAEEAGLRVERIEGSGAAALDEGSRADILTRMKNKVMIGGRLEDTLEENCVPSNPEKLQRAAFSKYGCAASHVKTMQRALEPFSPAMRRNGSLFLKTTRYYPW